MVKDKGVSGLANKYQIGFVVALLGLFSWASWEAMGFSQLARFFPLYVSIAAIILSVIQLIIEVRLGIIKQSSDAEIDGREATLVKRLPETIKYLGWFFGYFVLIYLIGIMAATVVFLFSFLLLEAKMRWFHIVIGVMSTVFIINLFGSTMNLHWPKSLFNLWF